MADWTNHILEDHEDTRWKVEARSGRKVEAIKAFRTQHGAPLKEAKDVVEAYDDRYKRGNTVNGRATVVTTDTVSLPDGGTLAVVSNGLRTSIIYNRVESLNLLPSEVPQAIADAVLKYSTRNQGPFA